MWALERQGVEGLSWGGSLCGSNRAHRVPDQAGIGGLKSPGVQEGRTLTQLLDEIGFHPALTGFSCQLSHLSQLEWVYPPAGKIIAADMPSERLTTKSFAYERLIWHKISASPLAALSIAIISQVMSLFPL